MIDVNYGVTSNNLVLLNEDMYIFNGGIANNTELQSEAFVFVDTGGEINDTVVSNGCEIDVLNGGTANGTVISSGGYVILDSDAKAVGTVVNGGGFTVNYGGIASDTTVNSAGKMYLIGGGMINGSTTVNQNGSADFEWGVHSTVDVHGGRLILKGEPENAKLCFLNSITIDSGGSLAISAGATVSSATFSNAQVTVFKSAALENAELSSTTIKVRDGALVSGADLKSGTVMNVTSGGILRDLTVSKGAVLTGVLYEASQLSFDGGTLGLSIADLSPDNAFLIDEQSFSAIQGSYTCTLTVNADPQAEGTYHLIKGAAGFNTDITVLDTLGATLGTLTLGGNSQFFGALRYTLIHDAKGLSVVISVPGPAVSLTGDLNSSFVLENGMVASSVNVTSGGVLNISKGGLVSQTTVNSSGVIAIYEGGVLKNAAINKCGTVNVHSGGTANNVILYHQMDAGAVQGLLIESGGIVNDTVVESGGLLQIKEDSVANSTIVNNNGWINLEGTANGVTVSSGGGVRGSDGKLTGKISFETGAMVTGSGTLDFDITRTAPDADALVNDLSPVLPQQFTYTLTVEGTEVDGSYKLAEGATDFNQTITVVNTSGTTLDTLTVEGGTKTIGDQKYTLTLTPGGLLGVTLGEVGSSGEGEGGGNIGGDTGGGSSSEIDITVGEGGSSGGGAVTSATPDITGPLTSEFNLTSGMLGSAVQINMGGRLNVFDGGVTSETTVNSSGCLYVSSGGRATNVTENGGYVSVQEGANVTFVPNSFIWLMLEKGDSATVHAGTVAENPIIASDGHLLVYNGGIASKTTITTKGELEVYEGGLASGVTIDNGATVKVFGGGSATGIVAESGAILGLTVAPGTYVQGTYADTPFELTSTVTGYTVHSNSWLDVIDSGSVNDTTVEAGGSLNISSGGRANNTTLEAQGALNISSGGLANGVAIAADAGLNVFEGGSATGIVAAEGASLSINVAPGTYVQGTYADTPFEVTSTVSGYTVHSGCELNVYDGGKAEVITVEYTADLVVSSGGQATKIRENGGRVVFYDGADVTFMSNTFSGLSVKGRDWTTVHAGTTATDIDITNYGQLQIYDGGLAIGAVVGDLGKLLVYDGGKASKATVKSAGHMLLSGGTATGATVNFGGALDVLGGVASNTTVNSGGDFNVSSGGSVNGVTVNPGAQVYISSGAIATNVKENGGYVFDDEDVTFASNTFTGAVLDMINWATVHSGTTAASATVNNGGCLQVFSSGRANDTIINNGGEVQVYDGGRATSASVNNGGYLLLSGGRATGTTVNNGGALILYEGGEANGFTIAAGAYLNVYGSAKVTGKMTFKSGSLLYAEPGAIFDFDISKTSPGADPIVNDISIVMLQSFGYTITVDASQTKGDYKLANGGTYFDQAITIVNTAGTTLGTLTIEGGKQTLSDGRAYTLTLTSGGLLGLTIGKPAVDTTPPVVSSVTADITAPTNQNVTVTAEFSDNVQVEKIRYKIGSGVWKDYTDGGVVVTENATVYFKAIDSSDNESEIASIVIDNIDKVAPTISGITPSTTAPAESVTVSAKFADNVGLTSRLYRIDDGDWTACPDGGVTVTENVTVYFKAVDTAGNETTSSYAVTNIGEALAADLTGDLTSAYHLKNGKVASSVSIHDGGELYVSSGGTAIMTTVSNDGDLIISSGGVASNTTVDSDGCFYICSGGTAGAVTVNYGGELIVSKGAQALLIMENGGYVEIAEGNSNVSFVQNSFSGFVYQNEDDAVTVHSGTTATGLTIKNGALLDVFSGGIARDATIGAGGSVFILSEGRLTGKMTFEQGAVVSASDGAVLDFDISALGPANAALMNDLSIVKGNPTYTLTISGAQAPGTYNLAGNAAGFDKSITVKSLLGKDVGTLTVAGGTTKIGNVYYTLALNEAALTVTVSDNGTVSGNEPANNTLYNKKTKEWNSAENIAEFVVNNITAGDSEVFLDKAGSVDDGKGRHNSLGRTGTVEDAADYAKIELGKSAALTFSVDSTVAGTFYVYQATTDKKGSLVATQRYTIAVKANKTSPAKATTIYLEAGEYFVGMETKLPAAKKGDVTGYYNVNLTGTSFFAEGDDGWNDSAYALDNAGKEIKTELNPELVAGALDFGRGVTDIKLDTGETGKAGYDNWVGFSDAADYRMLTLENAVNLTMSLTATGKAKLTIWKASTNAKTGAISLSSKGSVSVKPGAAGTIKAKFLEAGTYFVSVTSTDTAKGGGAYYNVTVDSAASAFFDSADDGANNELYNKKAKAFYADDKHKFVSTTIDGAGINVRLDSDPVGLDGYENFVGYGDKTDYAKVSLSSGGNLSFALKATGDATFTVYRKGRDKKGNDTLDTIQTTKLALAKGAGVVETTTNVLTGLEAGEYYISMTAKSTKNNSTGSVFYNVTATLNPSAASSLAMPESDSLAMTDSLSFGQSAASDVIAESAALGLLDDAANLDGKSTWQPLAKLA